MYFKVNTRVKEVGSDAIGFVKENMILFFGDMAPEDLRQYCFILNSHELYEEIQSGDLLLIDGYVYTIEEVGSVANENFKNLGHITLHFQYDESEILGGSIYLKEPLTHELHKDSIIAVKSASMQDKS